MKVSAAAANNVLNDLVVEQDKEIFVSTAAVFRTAYYIAKNDRPYLDHPELVDLQKANGINMGRILHSNTVCVDIVDHIANEMKKLITSVLAAKRPISVLIDESTSLSQKACLIVYLRCCFENANDPLSFFLDMVEISSATADGILEGLMKCLIDNGLTEWFLKEFWMGLATDGAAVMLGRKGGLCTKLKELFPNIISWHCFNHRIELSVHDAVKANCEINHFKAFLDKLYSLYSQSPKKRYALGKMCCRSRCRTEKNWQGA